MEKLSKFMTELRRFFYLKESEMPGYMNAEQIAAEMNRPMTPEEEAEFNERLPHEFARTMAEILEREGARQHGK